MTNLNELKQNVPFLIYYLKELHWNMYLAQEVMNECISEYLDDDSVWEAHAKDISERAISAKYARHIFYDLFEQARNEGVITEEQEREIINGEDLIRRMR